MTRTAQTTSETAPRSSSSSSPLPPNTSSFSVSSSHVNEIKPFQPPNYKWIRLAQISWTDPRGKNRTWEMAERTHQHDDPSTTTTAANKMKTPKKAIVDGVAIICLIHYPNSRRPAEILLVSQYRPPVQRVCVELPAGLFDVDADESPIATAIRELREETGYIATEDNVRYVSSACPCDPGMSNSDQCWVIVDIDGEEYLDHHDENNPKQHQQQLQEQDLDDGEFVDRHVVPLHGALHWLQEREEKDGMVIDARLYGLMIGLHKDLNISPFNNNNDDDGCYVESRDKNNGGGTTKTREHRKWGIMTSVVALGIGAALGSIATRFVLRK